MKFKFKKVSINYDIHVVFSSAQLNLSLFKVISVLSRNIFTSFRTISI